MATSGLIETKINNGSDIVGTNAWGKLEWTRTGVSNSDNTSTIKCKVHLKEQWGVYAAGSGTTYSKVRVTIDGKTTDYVGTRTSPGAGNYGQILEFSATIQHNYDGTKSAPVLVYISRRHNNADGAGKDDMSYSYNPISGTIALDSITRPATITDAPNFNDEDNPTITYSNPAGEAATTLMACISLTGAVDNVVYRDISKTGTSYTFNLTDAERATLRKGIVVGDSRTVLFMVRSVIDGKTYWSNVTRTFSLVNHTPTLSPVVEDTNGTTLALTGDKNTLIKYFSNAKVTFGAAGRKGATIIDRRVICGSQTINIEDRGQDVVTINGVDSNTFYLRARDSRNNIVEQAVTKTLIPYAKLTNSLKINSFTGEGKLTFTVSGIYYDGSFGAKDNTLELEYLVEDENGNPVFNTSGSGWVRLGHITPTMTGDYNYTYSYTITGLNHNGNYTLTVNAIDELTPVQTVTKVVAAEPIFDWGKDDFKFNVPIEVCDRARITKEGQFHGTTADGITIQAIDPCNNNNNLVIGYGNYGWDTLKTPDGQPAGTNIYGGIIRLNSRNDVAISGSRLTINGREYGANKVLWSGDSHMNANQVINLSQKISEQPNGIVLVFSYYEPSTGYGQSVGWSTHFVPKYMPRINGANYDAKTGGQFFMLGLNAGFSVIGGKYLFIEDQRIGGHTGNTQTGTNSGISFKNNQFSLRYVIGV